MPASKLQLAERAQRIILGGNPTADAEVSLQELLLYVPNAFGSIVRRRFFESKAEGESTVNGDFIFSFKNVEVKVDDDLDLRYVDVPNSPISLPRDMGVYSVSPMKDQANAIAPLPNGFNSLYSGLDSSFLEGRMGYYPEGNRLYFVNMDDSNALSKILMKLVLPIGSIDDEDQLNVPEDVQDEIVKMTVQLYQVQQQQEKDMINDNVK